MLATLCMSRSFKATAGMFEVIKEGQLIDGRANQQRVPILRMRLPSRNEVSPPLREDQVTDLSSAKARPEVR